MAKEKIIKNNVVWENFRLQEELNGFQGNLKIEDKKLNKKLQDRIIKVWFNAPIFIRLNNEKYYILDWHQRLQALSELSKRWYTLEWWKIPVVEILADTEIEAKERIMDYSSAYALFDIPVLQGRSQELDMEFTNIPELSLDTPSMGDDFDLPSDEIKTDIVLGDLFEIGEHRLLCGDSTDKEQVAKLMNGEKADCVITDPPYNVALGNESVEQAKKRNRRTDGLTIKNDKMSDSDFLEFLTNYFATTYLNTKKGGSIYVFFADMELRNFVNAFLDGGFKLSQQLIWKKSSLVMGRKDYQSMHEPILYGWNEGEAHNWYSDRKQTTILEFDKPSRNGEHPTMKPIAIIEYLINNSTKQKELNYDGFLGSGSTMVASHQLKRKCYGMELDPKYCQVIIDRMIKLDPTLEIKKNWLSYNPIDNG